MNNTAMTANFYQDKNILITGHTGFIGSWLTKISFSLHHHRVGTRM